MDVTILDRSLRRIPDFPKPGILFYDITGVLVNPEAFRFCIDAMVDIYRDMKIDAVAGVESRGFIFAAPFADRMGIPLVLVRKKGKLPGDTWSCSYQLEYGKAEVEIHKSDIAAGQRLLVIDDLIATGGTLKAVKTILEGAGASVAEFFGVVGLPFLNHKQVLAPTPVRTLIDFHSE
ncbi:adenine phosphoribosyltransferase [Treponema lecithinolyticum]|jgi:adenine phosphoribosyltransferase|uniref:Adenine phosphoribosyltransferase n=1 Tax=Treponema lecithinolyticum ATCC 700332 TaxID=1321815 RepID=A0ABN0NY48_TRELE|nr:adenine phosphoribosyltransferase [Treponema lecithinolyticum]ERJ92555.1 adenine phosphoribosyltransferase [Treponema lecithinolyticum ATCC 700332]